MRAPDRKSALAELQRRFDAAKAAGIVTPDDLQHLWPLCEIVHNGNGDYIGRVSHCPVAQRFPTDAIPPVEHELPPLELPRQNVGPQPAAQAEGAPSPEELPDDQSCRPGMCG